MYTSLILTAMLATGAPRGMVIQNVVPYGALPAGVQVVSAPQVVYASYVTNGNTYIAGPVYQPSQVVYAQHYQPSQVVYAQHYQPTTHFVSAPSAGVVCRT